MIGNSILLEVGRTQPQIDSQINIYISIDRYIDTQKTETKKHTHPCMHHQLATQIGLDFHTYTYVFGWLVWCQFCRLFVCLWAPPKFDGIIPEDIGRAKKTDPGVGANLTITGPLYIIGGYLESPLFVGFGFYCFIVYIYTIMLLVVLLWILYNVL